MALKSHITFEIDTVTIDNLAPVLNNEHHDEQEEKRELKARLDKWLWAARFFKTRPLARSAIENGRVFYNGEKATPSKEISVGSVIELSHGKIKRSVVIVKLSTRRHNNDEASGLYKDITPEQAEADGNNFSHHSNELHKPKNMVRYLRRTPV